MQLHHAQAELTIMNTKVALISFSPATLGQAWLDEMKMAFPLLLDPDRAAYQAYGLQRSWWRSWGWNNLSFYARQVLSGRKLHGIQGDSTQLGGDFIVDSAGILRYAYRSHDPTDRPPITDILATLAATSGATNT